MTESYLEQVWADREERVYPAEFGDTGNEIYPLSADLFTGVFNQVPDPRWLHCGVFACRDKQHPGMTTYLSSGLSNP